MLFTCISPVCEFDDYIHVIVTVKGFILPQFYCIMKTFHRPDRMKIDMPTTIDRPKQP
jgi:hypothetical protein